MFGMFRKREADARKEFDETVEALHLLLHSEERQNARYPPDLRDRVAAGSPTDYIPGGRGEFGRSATNPIPVNGPIGELLYLSSLRKIPNTHIFFHKLASENGVDLFGTVTSDGSYWDVMFFDMHHPRRSRIAPRGYRLSSLREGKRAALLRGADLTVEDFPLGLYEKTKEASERLFGTQLADPFIKRCEDLAVFKKRA